MVPVGKDEEEGVLRRPEERFSRRPLVGTTDPRDSRAGGFDEPELAEDVPQAWVPGAGASLEDLFQIASRGRAPGRQDLDPVLEEGDLREGGDGIVAMDDGIHDPFPDGLLRIVPPFHAAEPVDLAIMHVPEVEELISLLHLAEEGAGEFPSLVGSGEDIVPAEGRLADRKGALVRKEEGEVREAPPPVEKPEAPLLPRPEGNPVEQEFLLRLQEGQVLARRDPVLIGI